VPLTDPFEIRRAVVSVKLQFEVAVAIGRSVTQVLDLETVDVEGNILHPDGLNMQLKIVADGWTHDTVHLEAVPTLVV